MLDVIELLRQGGADVRRHDSYVPSIHQNSFQMQGEPDLNAAPPSARLRTWPCDRLRTRLSTGMREMAQYPAAFEQIASTPVSTTTPTCRRCSSMSWSCRNPT